MKHPVARRLISESALRRKVAQLARRINADYRGQSIVVIGVLKGAFVFMSDLVRQLTMPVTCDFIWTSSYGAATESSGQVRLLAGPTVSCQGRYVLVVEDIVDTGLTLQALRAHLRSLRPRSLRLVALLDKPSRRRVRVRIDYRGFVIPDRFVFGYGIDLADGYRNLPFIACREQ